MPHNAAQVSPGWLFRSRRPESPRAAGGPGGRAPVAQSGRVRSVIVILLSGGLGQHDSFDMKPDAPDGIRGEFKPIATSVPGIRMCEHLPGLAARAARLAVVRSMSHPEGNHLVAVHHVLTGHPSVPRGANDLDRVASRDDFPCYAAVLDRVRGRRDGVPSGVALPTRLIEGPLTWPGQDAGFLGPRHDPWQLRLDPNHPDAHDDSLALPPGLDAGRLHRRRHLLLQGNATAPGDPFSDQQEAAMALLSNERIGRALDLEREDPRVVDRYGRHSFGQTLLIAHGSSRWACRSFRARWESFKRGTRILTISHACAISCSLLSTGPFRLCSMTLTLVDCLTRPWS